MQAFNRRIVRFLKPFSAIATVFASLASLNTFSTGIRHHSFHKSRFSSRNTELLSKMRIEEDSHFNAHIIVPDEGLHSSTVIFMHGLGDSGDSFIEMVRLFGSG